MIDPLAVRVLEDLNPWWSPRIEGSFTAPAYRRPLVRDLLARVRKSKGVIEILRGPRQVGKTTAVHQIIEDLLKGGADPRSILFVRFDEQLLSEIPGGLSTIVRWFCDSVRKKPFGSEAPAWLFLDEIHKLRRWDDQVKHISDTFPVRLVLTGSSSVLVARGGRESLAGRTITTDCPTFQFREVLESWHPKLAADLPPSASIRSLFENGSPGVLSRVSHGAGLVRVLELFYNRGGYPRLHSGEIDEDRWADYLLEAVFDRVLGVDIPELFPVHQPQLLRHIYLYLARLTGQEISQLSIAESSNAAGYRTNQPTVGRYIHYLADSLLIREFRRYPLARKTTSRAPAKFTLTDLGVRNAIFRGAPSLAESPPDVVGPLVETLVQACLRGPGLQIHYYRDNVEKGNRRSPVAEVDFVIENIDGAVIPVEVKFRKTIGSEDIRGLTHFIETFHSPCGVLVTRDSWKWDPAKRILSLPLLDFLVRFGTT